MSHSLRSYLRRNPQFNEQKKSKAPFFSGPAKQAVQTKKEDGFFQPKLAVGKPGDKYEKEADQVASQVVNHTGKNAPAIQQKKISGIQRLATSQEDEKMLSTNDARMEKDKEIPEKPIQRKCAECEKEEKGIQKKNDPEKEKKKPMRMVQRKENNEECGTHSNLSSRIEQSSGKGRSMSQKTLMEFGSSFQTDFSDVKIHTDTESSEMNNELNAQAFTYGKDIYFNSEKYNPETSSGKQLLAHELTHVIQQSGEKERVQKEPGDKHDLTDSILAGNSILEECFDKDSGVLIGINFNPTGDHVSRIQQALLQLGIPLPQFGSDGKFGNETAGAVKSFQQSAGMSPKAQDGIVGSRTIALLDRSVRNNNIEKDKDDPQNDFKFGADPAKDEACKGKPTDLKCPDPNTDVQSVADKAIALISKVQTEQLPPVKNKLADYPAIFTEIFRKNDAAPLSETVQKVSDNFDKIKVFIGRLKSDKTLVRCATDCDGGCRSGSPAYHRKDKTGKDIINFCPGLASNPESVYIMIHECHHAAVPGSSDIAYGTSRLLTRLDHAKALLNATSFHTYAAWVDKPGSEPIGPAQKDNNLINDPSEKEKVDDGLAFIEQWFKLNTFDISETIQGVEDANIKGFYSKENHNASVFMELVFSKWYGLTKPPSKPTKDDIQHLQAIEQRLQLMENVFKGPFVILESPDHSFWSDGPGSDIALDDQTLKLDLNHLIIVLLQELVHATPNISADIESEYVGTINDMRNLRHLDP